MTNLLWFANTNQKTPNSGIPSKSPSAQIGISAKAAIHCRNHTLTQVRRIRRAHGSLRVDSIYAENHSSTSRRTPIDSINSENALDFRQAANLGIAWRASAT